MSMCVLEPWREASSQTWEQIENLCALDSPPIVIACIRRVVLQH